MRYIHILPIPMDDNDFDEEGFIRGGFYNWIFEQAELKNIMFDYIEGSKPVTKKTRARPKKGTLLLCPECKKTNRIYNFSWVAIVCLNCRAEVNKYDWRIANEQT